jgi:transporter family protein
MWIIYALLAALFAAITAILAKIGLDGVNPNLAVAVRTVVVLIMAWGIVFVTGKHNEIPDIAQKSWVFLGLSGIATGLSWLFFFKAMQDGEASKVVAIDKFSVVLTMIFAFAILGEALTAKTIIGGILITAGMLLFVL